MRDKVLIDRELLKELVSSLEGEVESRYSNGIKDHPAMRRDYECDIEPVIRGKELLAAAPAAPAVRAEQRAAITELAGWEKSLVAAWAADPNDPEGAWIIGAIDEDDNRYEVITIEANQYDAPGDSEKIARALIRLWAQAFATPPAHPDAALVEALEHARQFIRNGVDLGFIRMPDADAPDPAHETLPRIDAALSTYRAARAALVVELPEPSPHIRYMDHRGAVETIMAQVRDALERQGVKVKP